VDWARILAYVTGTVDQELLARNEYLDPNKKAGPAELDDEIHPAVKAPDACFYPKVPGTDCLVP